MKQPQFLTTVLAVLSISISAIGGELFPEGRLIDTNPASPASEIVAELAHARDRLVGLGTERTDLEVWELSQRFGIYVSQVGTRYQEEKQPYSKLPTADQTLIRDGYLMTELIEGYLDGSIADTSLAKRTIEEATQRLATSGRSPTVLACDTLWIIPPEPGSSTRVRIGGTAFQGTDQAPYLMIDDVRFDPIADSTGGMISFEIPDAEFNTEGGIGVEWIEFVAFERRKRGVFRSEIVELSTRIPIFVLPRIAASIAVTAEVDVSTSEVRPRRSYSVRVEGVGQEKTDSICLNAKAGAEIVPSTVELTKVTDELWAPDPVLPGQWILAEGSQNVFEKSGTTKRACVTVTARPVDNRHMAVAEAYMEFMERVGTTSSETRSFPFDLAWGVHHELVLPENTTTYRIDATFFDGSTETFEGPETHRWVLITWAEQSRTLRFTSQTP